jgi:hypothetical protein
MPAMIHKSCHDSKAVAQFQRLVVRGKYMWMTPHARRNNYFNNYLVTVVTQLRRITPVACHFGAAVHLSCRISGAE